MPGKVITTEFQIRGGVDSGFITSMTRATERTQQLKDEINSIESTLGIAKQFEAYEQKIRNTDEKLRALTAGTAEYIRTAAAAQKYADTFADLMLKLERAGVNTSDLTAETARLNGELSKTTTILNGMGQTIEAEAAELRKLSQEYQNFSAQYRQMFSEESARVGRTYATYINTANANGVYTIPGEGNVDYASGTLAASMQRSSAMAAENAAWIAESEKYRGTGHAEYMTLQRAFEAEEAAVLKARQTAAQKAAQKAALNRSSFMGGLGGFSFTGAAMSAFAGAAPAYLAGAAVRGAFDLAKASVTEAASFDKIVSELRAYTHASEEQTAALRDVALEIGLNTVFTAQEAARGMTYLGKAGWTTGQIQSGIRGVMNLAAASGEDLASVSSIVADTLGAFGMRAGEAQRFADVLAKTATRSNTDVGLLGDTFQTSAPVAGALGYSIEDVAQMVGILANVGIKGSRAGTTMRNILNAIASGFTVSGAAGEYKFTPTDANGNLKTLRETVDELRIAFSNLTREEQVQNAQEIANMRGYAGLLALVNASADEYERLAEEIRNADGAAKEMADTRLDNLAGDVTLLKSAFQGLKVEIGEALTPLARGTVQFATGVLRGISTNNRQLELRRQLNEIYTASGLHGVDALYTGRALLSELMSSGAFDEDFNAAAAKYLDAVASNPDVTDRYAAAVRALKRSYLPDETDEILSANEELEESYANVLEAAKESIEGQFALWEEAARDIPHDIYDMLSAQESQLEYWNEYAANLDALYKRSNGISGLSDFLANNAGTDADSVAMIAALEAASDAEIQAFLRLRNEVATAEMNASDAVAGNMYNITINAEGATEAVVERLEELGGVFAERVAHAIQQINGDEARRSLYA